MINKYQGILIGFVIGFIAGMLLIIELSISKKTLVNNGCGQYNAKTGKFELKEKNEINTKKSKTRNSENK